ncbi:nudix-type nucleoside diphosphatase, YffH/AdpP family [Mucilaginibacter pineti]|uniref:GDP-mannose pyrophosphatase n=1 Tax=Mucilaginibacter pineti TaxID=1391627 RepID=A0A1G7EIM2_9SPHI|nr:NUDIX domain-containing protein [Mucilaginibacter pineti]SDE63519.1 nudix-type nucleoside diphosphatase, YffH/AdpP family [Mucilaginibacter pineti]
MASIQILDKETLSHKTYLLEEVTYQKPDLEGKLHEQKNEIYYRPDAVAVLLADRAQEKFILTRQFRLATFLNGNDSGYLVETCAGLIDEGETPEQAARREVVEETGYLISSLRRIGAAYSSAGGITEYLYLFIADCDCRGEHGKGGGLESEGEDIELVQLSFSEAKEKLLAGGFRDAKTIMLLQHYFLTA